MGKLQKRNKSKESVRFEMIPEAAQENGTVVKTKKYVLTPMTVDRSYHADGEAAAQFLCILR